MPHRLRKKVTTIGRDPRCEITIDQGFTHISRRHAEIRRQQGGYFVIQDLSSQGTRVNGAPVRQQVLQDGDTIALADQMTFTYWKGALYAPGEKYKPDRQEKPQRAQEPIQIVHQQIVVVDAPRWGTGTMIALAVATLVIPLVGLVAGIVGLTQRGKRGQGFALIVWAVICGVINYMILMEGGLYF
jgi:hypothetical protein